MNYDSDQLGAANPTEIVDIFLRKDSRECDLPVKRLKLTASLLEGFWQERLTQKGIEEAAR